MKTQGWVWGRIPPPSHWTAAVKEENMKKRPNMEQISTLFRYATV